jgi:hypothetical protein
MRDAGRLRSGFFAIPPEALDVAMRWLVPGRGISVLDPCAGEGLALKQIGERLGVTPDRLWAIELDGGRGRAVRENLPGATVLAPCSFFHTGITTRSFSMVYANPPFDESVGGGRVETQFFAKAYQLLVDGGILLGVCPENVAVRYDVRKLLHAMFDDLRTVEFPEAHRKYGEVFIVGRKRTPGGRVAPPSSYHAFDHQDVPTGAYLIPSANGPSRFEKTALTDEELIELLQASPLRSFLKPKAVTELPSPPLSLGVGHLALLLSAGQLDGVVRPEGEPAHLVRGTARKEKVLVDEEVTEEGGNRVTKQHYTERIKLVVRCATEAGEIVTLE